MIYVSKFTEFLAELKEHYEHINLLRNLKAERENHPTLKPETKSEITPETESDSR